VWRWRRRLRQLEDELVRTRVDQAELRRRLEMFEMIAASAGAETVSSAHADAALPPELLAAARELRGRETPVRLDIAGAEVIAVIGGDGDPREWWTAIRQMACREEASP
jgi:hypothetical protein